MTLGGAIGNAFSLLALPAFLSSSCSWHGAFLPLGTLKGHLKAPPFLFLLSRSSLPSLRSHERMMPTRHGWQALLVVLICAGFLFFTAEGQGYQIPTQLSEDPISNITLQVGFSGALFHIALHVEHPFVFLDQVH